jgi:hypothetical protein
MRKNLPAAVTQLSTLAIFSKDEHRVVPSETEGIGKCRSDLPLPRHMRHIIKVTIRVRVSKVYGGWDHPTLDGKNTYYCLDSTSGSNEMPHH